jgi:hypothetical protein
MTDARDPGEKNTGRTYKSYLWDLGVAVIFGLLSFGLSVVLKGEPARFP